MKKRKQVCLAACSLLLSTTVLLPLTVSAGATLVKEQSFISNSDSEEDFKGKTEFAEEIKEDGIPYVLDQITYEILNTTYLDKKQKIVEAEVWGSTEQTTKEILIEDETEYELVQVLKGTSETVTEYEEYDYYVSESDVPAEKAISVVNQLTQKTEEVTAALSGITQTGTTTEKSQMYITFIGYDADYYIWNNHIIPKNDTAPALTGYETELLKAAGVANGSVVTSISWSGGTYTNSNGVLCRNAVAGYETEKPIYHANYSAVKTNYQYIYEAEDVEGRAQYEVKATAHYRQSGLSTAQYILTGIGILLVISLVVIVIMVLAKRRKKKEEIV